MSFPEKRKTEILETFLDEFSDLPIRVKKLTRYFQNTLMAIGKDIRERVPIRLFSVSYHLFKYYYPLSSIQESFCDSDLIIFSNKRMITRVLNMQNDFFHVPFERQQQFRSELLDAEKGIKIISRVNFGEIEIRR